jgi:hypothetical protein
MKFLAQAISGAYTAAKLHQVWVMILIAHIGMLYL